MSVSRVKIRELADQVRGVSYGKEDVTDAPRAGFLPVLRAGNITDDGLVFDDLVFVPAERISEKQKIQRNDVVIAASSGSLDIVGKAAQALEDFDGGFGAFCKVLRPNSKVHPRYFAQFFKTPEYRRRISALAEGVNINNLRNEHLDDMEIPLPSLEEQRRIADILDGAEALRVKRQATLARLDTLARAIFIHLFGDPVANPKGWPTLNFEQLCERVTVGIVVRPASYYVPHGVPALRSLNIKRGYISLEELVYVSEADNRTTLAKTRLKAGDLVIVRSGQPGTAAVVPSELDGVNAIDLLIATPNREVSDAVFLCHFFNSAGGDHLVLASQRGQIQKHLNVGALNRAVIPLPPIELQREFARRVTAVEKLKTAQQTSLSETDALFDSLQYRAFRGEL